MVKETVKLLNMEKSNVIVILDPGHEQSVLPAKCSPLFEDGKTRLEEWSYNRTIVSMLAEKLRADGIDVRVNVTEKVQKIGLSVRASRANKVVTEARKAGKTPLFVSVHVNAAGNGQWMNAKGWSCFTTKGKTISDAFATKMYEAAHEVLDPMGRKIREDYSDGDPDWEENFTVIKKTNCAAILTENFFMDNKEEAAWLLTDEGKETVVEIHYRGILKYIASL